MTEHSIFLAALDVTDPAGRAAYLAQACGDNLALHQRVLNLLDAHERAGDFLAASEFRAGVQTIDATPGSGDPGGLLAPRGGRATTWIGHLTEKPGDRIGPYKLLQQIGEGGFGVVWMADQERPVRRRVALKIIKAGMDTKEVIARFEQERQALAMMEHPNIAKVLDAGATATGRPYFVMELVRGVKVTDYCDEQGLSTPERIELFIHVCHAVQHAHQKGIIHRDLKPSNILVTINDGEAVPKVIDFGVAKATQGRLTDGTLFTQFEQMVGTPMYMSPEQAEMTSLDIDTRSDIYSLGVLLYELLTGRTPIDSATLARAGMDEIRRIIREVDPPRPSMRVKSFGGAEMTTAAKRRHTDRARLPAALRGDLDWIVMKCLEKDRKRRYDTATGLAADLRRHLKNDVVLARPPTAGYLLSKLARRHKLAFAAGAAVAASLVIGIAASVWQAVRATNAEREQNELRHVAVKALDGEKLQHAQAKAERERAEANAVKARETAVKAKRSQYSADVYASTAQIEKGNYILARNVLREYFPRDGSEELRGFEWRYWWQLSAGQQLKTFPVTGKILDMAWSPDGRFIAEGNTDGTAKVLRAATGEVTATLTHGYDFAVSIALSHDGNGLAAAGHGGKRIATANFGFYTSGLQAVILWDVDSGRKLNVLKDMRQVLGMAFSPDGSQLAIGKRSGEVTLWNLNDFSHAVLRKRTEDFARSVAFSPDGRSLAVGLQTHEVEIWDVAERRLAETLRGHTGEVSAVAYSPDGTRLASGCEDGTIRIWDPHPAKAQKLIPNAHLPQYFRVGHPIFSPDSRSVATALQNGDVQIVDPATADWDVRKVLQNAGLPVAFSGDGVTLLTLTRDLKTLNRWNVASGGMLSTTTLESTDAKWVRSATTPDGSHLALATQALIEVYETRTGHRVASFKPPTYVQSIELSRDGRLLTIGGDATGLLWDIAAGRILQKFAGHNNQVTAMNFSPDQKKIASTSWDATVRLWDPATGRELGVLTGHKAGILNCVFSPDGRTLITGSDDRTIRFWNLATCREVASIPLNYATHCFAFSPDGQILMANNGDGGVRCWRAPTLAEIDAAEARDAAAVKQP